MDCCVGVVVLLQMVSKRWCIKAAILFYEIFKDWCVGRDLLMENKFYFGNSSLADKNEDVEYLWKCPC